MLKECMLLKFITPEINFFQKARNFRSFLGYIGVSESENALSIAELALVFNKNFHARRELRGTKFTMSRD